MHLHPEPQFFSADHTHAYEETEIGTVEESHINDWLFHYLPSLSHVNPFIGEEEEPVSIPSIPSPIVISPHTSTDAPSSQSNTDRLVLEVNKAKPPRSKQLISFCTLCISIYS